MTDPQRAVTEQKELITTYDSYQGAEARAAGAGLSERRRLAISIAALAALYVAIAVLGDTRAWSGSDAGGKVATVKMMAERGDWTPDVGYWAERADPAGTFHPLLYTTRTESMWVQATSLPLVYLGRAVWPLGHTGALLAVPMASGLLAAVAARSTARSVGAVTGWPAFWVVGAASPVLFYTGDFWEHAPGVALALAAIAVFLGGDGIRRAALVGGLAGAATVLRTEMFVYTAAFGVACVLVTSERRRLTARWMDTAVMVATFATVVVGSALVELAIVGESVRASRSTSNLTAAGSELSDRVHDAVLTSIGLFAEDDRKVFVAGTLLALGLALVALGDRARRPALVRGGVVVVVVLYVVRFAEGLGFVPGVLAATPLAVVGLVVRAPARARVLVATATLALPVVWAVQWRGQLLAQWGGRYVLLSGVLLAIVAATALDSDRRVRPALAAVVVAAVAVTVFGAAWHVRRTSSYAAAFADLERLPDDVVVITTLAHLGREAGAFYGDHRWLAARPANLDRAVDVARRMGARDLAVVLSPDEDPTGVTASGYRREGTTAIDILGFDLPVIRFVRT